MKTRAALFHAVGTPLEVVEIDLAEPRPHEVVVRMAAVGICGTDLHQVKGEFRRPTPMVLGHEGAGVVEEVGDAVTRVRPGDDVVLSWAPVRRVRRLPARAPRDVRSPERRHPERDAPGRVDRDDVPRRDGLPRYRDRVPRGTGGRRRAGCAAARGGRALRPGGAPRLRGAHGRRCGAVRGRGGARRLRARDRGGRCRAVRRPGRADRGCRDDRRVRSRGGQAGCRARRGSHARRCPGRAPRRDAGRAPRRRRLRLRRGGVPRHDHDGAPLHAGRRHRRDRRPAAPGGAARPRPLRADPEGEEAHRDVVRIGGPGGRSPGDAGARPRGQARPRLLARAVVSTRASRRGGAGEPGRRVRRVLVLPDA